jgi:hypothetical protein
MPDRRDFRLVFLCATSGITWWVCFDHYQRPALAVHGGGR